MTINQILQTMLDPIHSMDPKLIQFLNAYINTSHIQESCKIAGLRTEQGRRILNKKDVQVALLKVSELHGKRAAFTSEELLERASEVAQFDPIEIFNEDGTIKPIKEISGAARRAIKEIVVREVIEKDINGIESVTGYIKTIKFWDKIKGLELLGSYDGTFKKKVEHTHELGNNFAEALLSSEKRAIGRDVTPEAIAIQASKVELVDE